MTKKAAKRKPAGRRVSNVEIARLNALSLEAEELALAQDEIAARVMAIALKIRHILKDQRSK